MLSVVVNVNKRCLKQERCRTKINKRNVSTIPVGLLFGILKPDFTFKQKRNERLLRIKQNTEISIIRENRFSHPTAVLLVDKIEE
jgi:hypothetical protein